MERYICVSIVATYLDMQMKDRPTFLGFTLFGWYLIVLLATIVTCILCCSCGSIKPFGVSLDTKTIELPKGMKLIDSKIERDSSIWIFMEPMDSGYTAKTRVLQKTSKYGIIERKFIFKEIK